VNGSPLTDRALGIGALAGVTKAGILAFVGFLGFANLNIAAYMLLVLFGSVFGIAVLVTLQVANTVLGESQSCRIPPVITLCHSTNLVSVLIASSQLLIAAVVAAIPLQGEGIGMYFCKSDFQVPQHRDLSGCIPG
jgi:hypothetical protein